MGSESKECRNRTNPLDNFLSYQRGDFGLFSHDAFVHMEEEVIPQAKIVAFSGEACSMYDAIEKDVVCLDLTQEKPWERKERLVQEVQRKQIPLLLAQEIVERIGLDLARLMNEVEKLLTYAAKPEKKDVEAIIPATDEATGWQVAEQVVWRHKPLVRQIVRDLSEVLSLFSLVRHHLQMGLQLCTGGTELSIRKNQRDLYAPICERMGASYFHAGLALLFEWEVKAKSVAIEPTLLWDLFIIHYDTLLTPQSAPSGR